MMEYTVKDTYSEPSHFFCLKVYPLRIFLPATDAVVAGGGIKSKKRSSGFQNPSISTVFAFLPVQEWFCFCQKGKLNSLNLLIDKSNRLKRKNRVPDFSYFSEKIYSAFLNIAQHPYHSFQGLNIAVPKLVSNYVMKR